MRYRYLFEQMIRRELRQKYKGSALGVLWYVVNPLVLMGAYSLMFTYVLRYDAIDDYPLFLLIGITIWVFFSQTVTSSATALIDQSALVRKVRFPRETIPAAVVAVQLVIFAVLFVLLVPLCVAIRGSLGFELLVLPLLVVALAAFVLGCALAVAILHAYFRDVSPIVSAALLPWFFVTPIFFRPDAFPGEENHPWIGVLLRWANPVAPFIESVRDVLYDGRMPGLGTAAYVLAASALALGGGWLLFRRMQRELAVVL